MAGEIIVKYNMRAGRIALSVFGLAICVLMTIFGWSTMDSNGARHNPEGFFATGILGVVFIIWNLRSLCDGKPFLETSEDGIFIGERLHCYVPWKTVKDIKIRTDYVEFRQHSSTVKVLAIELIDPDNVYFDKLSHRLLRKYFFREFPIDLIPDTATSWTSERLRDALRRRWAEAVNTPATNDASDE